MSNFERMMAQFDEVDQMATQPGVPDAFGQMNIPPPQQPPNDPSLLDRFKTSAAERGSSIADTLANASGLDQAQVEDLNGAPMTPEEQIRTTNSAGDTAVQLIGDTLGFVWDMGGNVLTEAVTEGFDLLPESTQEATKAQFAELMNSEVGQKAQSALNSGLEAWKRFEEEYPVQAKTVNAALNITPMGQPKRIRKVFDTELTPMRIKDVGGRKKLSAPQGRDKDIFNIITPELSKKERLEQLKKGNVSSPQGISRSHDVILDDQQWKVVDEVKKLPVNAAKTNTHNSNIIMKEIDKLNQQTINKAAKSRGGIERDIVMQDVQQALHIAQAQNPAIFGAGGKKGQKTIADLMAQMELSLDKHGTDYQGLLLARQEFDHYLNNQLQLGTFGNGRKASVAGETHRAVRDTLNGYVKNNVPDTADLLDKQHRLFQGWDGVSLKAVDESRTAVGRLLQLMGLHRPSTPYATVATAASPMVWLAGLGAVAVSPFVLAYRGGIKPLTHAPGVRQTVGFTKQTLIDFRNESVKLAKHIKDPEVLKAYRADLKVLASMIHTYEEPEEEAK